MTRRRSAHPTVPRRGPRPSRVPKHAFRADPDIPPDLNGRQYCICGVAGQPGDARHYSSDEAADKAAANREYDERRLGER